MLFSSNLFLYVFFPLVLICHTVSPTRFRNLFLLAASLAFYSWGSGPMVLLLLCSITINYLSGLALAKYDHRRGQVFVMSVAFNLGLLFYYKYFFFVYHELGRALLITDIQLPPVEAVPLPIGISFFTFQAIAYLSEVYRRQHAPTSSIIDYALFITLFPHLIAGPVVRFSEISEELSHRKVGFNGIYEGMWRFSLGLGKKVIIANSLGAVADKIFNLPPGELSTSIAWIGAVSYTFQIYFDFSGYSDMAIGLARMFGFYFPENFNQPYRASTVTDFWRRWHMSLSRWFRDFVYIPLGGNRCGEFRTARNLWLVFFLCGLWHGAAWTFVIWGIYHGVLLGAERCLKVSFNFESKGVIGNILTMFLVIIGWVIFRAESIPQAWTFLGHMFGRFPTTEPTAAGLGYYLHGAPLFMLVVSLLFSWLPVEKGTQVNFNNLPWLIARSCAIVFLMLVSSAILATSAFNPFIYFRF